MVQRCRTSRALRFAGVGLAMVGLVACGDTGPLSSGDAVDAATYEAVIDRFMPPPRSSGSTQVVYVAGVGGATLSLDDQVKIIDSFEAEYDVRFVDDFDAAVDPDLDGAPPRDDGVLIGVGKITDAPPHTVRVEVYVAADEIDAQLVTVVHQAGVWVIDAVEPVEPEVLVGDE
ncbi:MAG: hypothetical protein QNJ12_05860 [Ilumatobacter sp.]|uniref:hypothetical protein n=1 Tax=Ilumatobacter sp. TaxID=1967498 RepID=UPI002601C2EB|nr:hypothetical protein [Ilumatobacter sp.]MDJ0768296.1 hypothetical protein [Ilumatobacter sp.]